MADSKISAFGSGGKIQLTDSTVISRGSNDFKVTGGEMTHPNALARASGYVCWTGDPMMANATNTQANTHLVGVFLTVNDTITGIAVPVSSAGSTMTGGWVAVYDSSLNQVATSTNQSTLFEGTTGWISVPLSSTYTPSTGGLYYLASGYLGSVLPTIVKFTGIGAISTGYPASGKVRGVHAAVPTSGGLPNPATSVSTFTDSPVLIAY